MRHVVVTGASTGIGYACAESLIKKDCQVWGSVRKDEDAKRLSEELGANFTPLILDITNHDAVKESAQKVSASLQGTPLFGLVNNAGIAITGPSLHVPMDLWRYQFEVNFFSQIAVIQAFTPLLKSNGGQKPGRIVNMSSLAGKVALPFFGPYASSKFALEALSDSLRRELLLYAIKLIVVEPGRIKTPIWGKARDAENYERYRDTDYAEMLQGMYERVLDVKQEKSMLPVSAISKVVLKALFCLQPKIRYVIPENRATWHLGKIIPEKLLDKALGKHFKFI